MREKDAFIKMATYTASQGWNDQLTSVPQELLEKYNRILIRYVLDVALSRGMPLEVEENLIDFFDLENDI